MPPTSKKKKDTTTQSYLQNSQNLFEYLKNENVHLRVLVIDWLRHYRTNETEALASLLSFVIQSCGLNKDTVTLDDLERNDMEVLVAKIFEEAKETEEYPLVSKNRLLKNFYSNFQFFWVHLVTEAGDELYDGTLLNFIISWMSSLTFSKMRPVRHTSTAGILSTGQALIDIMMREVHDLDRVRTFIQTELNKAGSGNHLTNLKEQEKEVEGRVKALTDILDSMFKDVISFRCRDVMMEIRALCIQSMGYWAEKYPLKFLNNKILEVMGMMLFDKASEVRENVLGFLSKTYNDVHMEKLHEFTFKNKLRIVEMCHDIDTKCCVEAIKVCTLLTKAEKLTTEEQDMVSSLLWAESEDVRAIASEFVGVAVFAGSLPKENSFTGGLGLEQGRNLSAEKGILSLVHFFRDFGDEQMYRVDLLVKAFWNRTSCLREWEAICELLRRGDPSRPGTTPLEQLERTCLVNMLISALKNLQNSPDKKQRNNMITLSTTIISHLPVLLTFYRNDIQMVRELIKVPLYLELSALASKDLKDPFHTLCATLKHLLYSSNDGQIILKSGQSLGKFSREAHPLQKEAKSEMTKLIDDCCTALKKEFINFTLEGEEGVLETWLWRVESLIAVVDILDELGDERFEDLTSVVTQYLSNSHRNAQLTLRCVEILYYWDLWYLNRITNHPVNLDAYNEKRNHILELFSALVAKQDTDFDLRKMSFKYLCETLMVVSGQKAVETPIHFEVGSDVWGTIEEYMTEVPIEVEVAIPVNPSRSFHKIGAKTEASKEDADTHSQMICLHIARLICMCPSITASQLPSSFYAHYGPCQIKAIAIIVKHSLTAFKAKETAQSNPQEGLLFNIMLESLIKSLGNGDEDDVAKMKEIGKKFVMALGPGPMRPRQADKFLSFLIDGVSFAFSDKANFGILDGLAIFACKNYLSPSQIKEFYERISKDADRIEEKIKQYETEVDTLLYPVRKFLFDISKVVGVNRPPPVGPSDRARKMLNIRRSEVTKDTEVSIFRKAIKKSAVRGANDGSVKEENPEDELYLPTKIEDNGETLSIELRPNYAPGITMDIDEDEEAVYRSSESVKPKRKFNRQPKKPEPEPILMPNVAVKKSAKKLQPDDPATEKLMTSSLKAIKKSAKPASPDENHPIRGVKKSAKSITFEADTSSATIPALFAVKKSAMGQAKNPRAIKKSAKLILDSSSDSDGSAYLRSDVIPNPQIPPTEEVLEISTRKSSYDTTIRKRMKIDESESSNSEIEYAESENSESASETEIKVEEYPEQSIEIGEDILTINTNLPQKRIALHNY